MGQLKPKYPQSQYQTEAGFLECIEENHSAENPLLRKELTSDQIKIANQLVKKDIITKFCLAGNNDIAFVRKVAKPFITKPTTPAKEDNMGQATEPKPVKKDSTLSWSKAVEKHTIKEPGAIFDIIHDAKLSKNDKIRKLLVRNVAVIAVAVNVGSSEQYVRNVQKAMIKTGKVPANSFSDIDIDLFKEWLDTKAQITIAETA